MATAALTENVHPLARFAALQADVDELHCAWLELQGMRHNAGVPLGAVHREVPPGQRLGCQPPEQTLVHGHQKLSPRPRFEPAGWGAHSSTHVAIPQLLHHLVLAKQPFLGLGLRLTLAAAAAWLGFSLLASQQQLTRAR